MPSCVCTRAEAGRTGRRLGPCDAVGLPADSAAPLALGEGGQAHEPAQLGAQAGIRGAAKRLRAGWHMTGRRGAEAKALSTERGGHALAGRGREGRLGGLLRRRRLPRSRVHAASCSISVAQPCCAAGGQAADRLWPAEGRAWQTLPGARSLRCRRGGGEGQLGARGPARLKGLSSISGRSAAWPECRAACSTRRAARCSPSACLRLPCHDAAATKPPSKHSSDRPRRGWHAVQWWSVQEAAGAHAGCAVQQRVGCRELAEHSWLRDGAALGRLGQQQQLPLAQGRHPAARPEQAQQVAQPGPGAAGAHQDPVESAPCAAHNRQQPCRGLPWGLP